MKSHNTQHILLLTLLITLSALSLAPTIIDQLDADFNVGTLTNVNVTSNTVILSGSPGSYSASGTFTSNVKNLGSNPTATIGWSATSASGTSLLVSTRAGNTASPDGTWTSWSSNYGFSNGSLVTNAQRRYYQYRLQLATTNTSNTPTVNSVTLTYTEAGPNVSLSGLSGTVNSDSSGSLAFRVTVADTVALANISARYRIGSDAYSAWTTMSTGPSYYQLTIAEPAGGWDSRVGENVTMQAYYENTDGDNDTLQVQELIDQVNNAPILNNIADTYATEGIPKTIFASGSDPDGDTITFSSNVGTVSMISSTLARIDWTPSRTQTGNFTVTITVSDGNLTDSQDVNVEVADVNDPPTMSAVTSQSGHYGERIIFDITVLDNDTNENITFYVQPDVFDVEPYTPNVTANFTYYGRADFIALDDHKGNISLVFYATDGESTTSQNATLSITYCGDNICQAVENETSCRADCYQREIVSYISLEVPQRICANESMRITSYNASSRYTCYVDGKTHQGAAYCNPQGGVEVQIYAIDKDARQELTAITTGTNGSITWIPPGAGQYKLIASKEGLVGSSQIITAGACLENINLVERIVNFSKPQITAVQRNTEVPPQLEEPSGVPVDEASILSILIFYIIVPILLAGLIYTGNAYYDLYKDVDPRLLALRIKMWELQQRWGPVVRPYWDKTWRVIGPLVRPVWNAFITHAWPLFLNAFLWLKRLIKR